MMYFTIYQNIIKILLIYNIFINKNKYCLIINNIKNTFYNNINLIIK